MEQSDTEHLEKWNILKSQGFLLLPVDHDKAKKDRELFQAYISNIPELKEDAKITGDIGTGSFGALNFASSYHNPAAVSCDMNVLLAATRTLDALANDLGLKYMQLIPDRLCYRTRAQPPESYHYDATSGAEEGDCFFGSIYNLNENLVQKFTCVPGTHKLCADVKGGAYTPTDKMVNVEYKKREATVSIPPFHALLFFENIIHRVTGGVPIEPIRRKFVGFRLTNSPRSWMHDKNTPLMITQGPLYHKGGQLAPMYPRLYLTNHTDKLQQFADRLRPELLTDYTFKSGKRKGETITIPLRFPPSLEQLDSMYTIESNTERFKIRKVGN